MIGKLKKSLNERCPECGKILQIRTTSQWGLENGTEAIIESEYVCCSNKNCDYERSVEKKRRKRQEELPS